MINNQIRELTIMHKKLGNSKKEKNLWSDDSWSIKVHSTNERQINSKRGKND